MHGRSAICGTPGALEEVLSACGACCCGCNDGCMGLVAGPALGAGLRCASEPAGCIGGLDPMFGARPLKLARGCISAAAEPSLGAAEGWQGWLEAAVPLACLRPAAPGAIPSLAIGSKIVRGAAAECSFKTGAAGGRTAVTCAMTAPPRAAAEGSAALRAQLYTPASTAARTGWPPLEGKGCSGRPGCCDCGLMMKRWRSARFGFRCLRGCLCWPVFC